MDKLQAQMSRTGGIQGWGQTINKQQNTNSTLLLLQKYKTYNLKQCNTVINETL